MKTLFATLLTLVFGLCPASRAQLADDVPAERRPDYSRLYLKGDHHARDSFSLTMQAVARLFGVDLDYETVYALSTNGFAPDIHPPESCRSFWRMHGRGRCLDLVSARLGLEVQPLAIAPEDRPWEAIRDALTRGYVVITDRGWKPDVYCWWGIILDAPAGGPVAAIRGATQNGRTDNPLDHFGSCWAIRRADAAISAGDADVAMLERAATRIRGAQPPFEPGDVVFGLPAMDLWIAQMRKPAFQEDDPFSSAGNARLCALYTCQGAEDVESYLRRRLPLFPEEARQHLDAAADEYAGIARLLAPFTVSHPDMGYNVIVGSPERQEAHIEDVLLPCRTAMAKAADHLERAVDATGWEPLPEADMAQPGDVLLRKVVNAFEDTCTRVASHRRVADETIYPQPCMYLVTHLAEMQSLGWEIDFDTLAAVSGASALFGYEYGNFMPKYAHAFIGMDRRIASATGFGYEWLRVSGPEDAWGAVKGTIDAGMPAKGWHAENILFVGYREADQVENRQVFALSDGPEYVQDWWSWDKFRTWARGAKEIGRHTGRMPPAAVRETAKRVMRDLVGWSNTPPTLCQQQNPRAAFGLRAIQTYADDCADMQAFDDWKMCHDINPYWTLRRCTANYLEQVATDEMFAANVCARIQAAASLYKQAYASWRECYSHVGYAAPPGSGKNPEQRAAGAAAVRRALQQETAAIEELREALALSGG